MGQPGRQRLVIDGFNVLHATVLQGRERDEWWSADHQLKVLELVARFDPPEALSSDLTIAVVFDAARPNSARCTPPQWLPSYVSVAFAPDADEWILEQAREHSGQLVVVSADRSMIDRARHLGAGRMSPWNFAECCR